MSWTRLSGCVPTLLSSTKGDFCFRERFPSYASTTAAPDSRCGISSCRWSALRGPADDLGGLQKRLGAVVADCGPGDAHSGCVGMGVLPVWLLWSVTGRAGD